MCRIVVRVGCPLVLRQMVDRPLMGRLGCISRRVMGLLLKRVDMGKVHSLLLRPILPL